MSVPACAYDLGQNNNLLIMMPEEYND